MAKKQVFDDGIFTRTVITETVAEGMKDVLEHFANPFTALEWIGSIAEIVARELLPYLVDGADELPMPGEQHLRKDAPEAAHDLLAAWEYCYTLGQSATREGRFKFDFTDLTQAYYLGCAIQRWKVRPKAPLVQKHNRQIGKLAEARAKTQAEGEETRRKCVAAMKRMKQKNRGSRVTHTTMQKDVAKELGISLRTVKEYTPKNPKK